MQVSISVRHGHLSVEAQARIREKLEKLQRFFDRVTSIELMADLERRDAPLVELRVSVEHAADLVAREQSSGVMAAVDGVVHKLENQLRKHKEKLTGHRASGLKHREIPVEPEPDLP